MKPLEVLKYLYDIREACELIIEFTSGKEFDDYTADAMLRSAVERQFEIIGEALNQALHLDSDLRRTVTDTAMIVAFRNRLIHAYASISDRVVWGVIETSLPKLHREVVELLEERGSSEDH